MRNLNKLCCPEILVEKHNEWLAEYLENPESHARKTRYRHKDIKERVKEETFGKCIYCESYVGHNTPGDVEHLQPVKHFPDQRFVWDNLSLACTECNRRKSDYTHPDFPFLNPYADDVEAQVIHLGPIVTWQAGNKRSEITIKKLQMNNNERKELLFRKIEAVAEFDNLLERFLGEENEVIREMLRLEILSKGDTANEFSGLMCSLIEQNRNIIDG